MLLLFETPAGFALFRVRNEKKLKKLERVDELLEDTDKISQLGSLSLESFQKFKDTADAVKNTYKMVKGKLPSKLKKFLKKNIISKEIQDNLAVADKKLGKVITKKLGIQCQSNEKTDELIRVIRFCIADLVEGVSADELKHMSLGLAHGLSRYKLKISSDKVDTMIIQAISLLENLDKEINNYMMRLREWYGYHFPELSKIISDNLTYSKVVKQVGMRHKAVDQDLSGMLTEEIEKEVKEAAEISMGSEISEKDEEFLLKLADQIIEFDEYRASLQEYLKNRMNAVCPNLTVLIGELVGAKLISHSGSLLNLAKHAASTIQILGAEKALFKAMRTKHNTPKYGLLYQASLIGQTPALLKGKMSRALAAKCAICVRMDALGEDVESEVGMEAKQYLDNRLSFLESQLMKGDGPKVQKKFVKPGAGGNSQYNESSDITVGKIEKLDKTFVKASKDVAGLEKEFKPKVKKVKKE